MWLNYHDYDLERHLHTKAYADVILEGSYEELGDIGRVRVEPGDFVLHEAFESHLDRFPSSGVRTLSFDLPAGFEFPVGLCSADDPDAIIKLARSSDVEAAALLLKSVKTRATSAADWPDELANALTENPSISLTRWAEETGVKPWNLSRGFAQVFGLSPSAFRARSRTRHALKLIQRSDASLGEISADLGFSDQAHMTRSIKGLTGIGPSNWRMSANRFKTA